jgi:hypothetical protein
VSVKKLHERTNSLTLNQLVIQATNRLTTNIINGDCRGLQDFYITEESKKLTRITRSTENGDLITTTIKNIPNPGFRNQSAELWNTLTNDRKISKLSLTNYPPAIVHYYLIEFLVVSGLFCDIKKVKPLNRQHIVMIYCDTLCDRKF